MSKSKAASVSSSLVSKGGAVPSQQSSVQMSGSITPSVAEVEAVALNKQADGNVEIKTQLPDQNTEIKTEMKTPQAQNDAVVSKEQSSQPTKMKVAETKDVEINSGPVEPIAPARIALISATVKVEEPIHIKLRQYCAITRKTSQEVFTEALQMYFSKYGIK